MGVNHCGFDISMAKQLTYRNQWHTRHYQMARKRMPQVMEKGSNLILVMANA